jgi:hypothetical protein
MAAMSMNPRQIRLRLAAALFLCGAIGVLVRAASAAQTNPGRDFTLFVFSDTHLGAEQPKANPPVTKEQVIERVQKNLERMRQLPGQSFPSSIAGANPGGIAVPRSLFILGDLADGHKDPAQARQQWHTFEMIFPREGIRFSRLTVPIFAIAGNHDRDPSGPQRRGPLERNRALSAMGHLSALSENGVHFALNWDGVHLICVNLCPADSVDEQTPFRFGRPGPGSWNDPQMALSFVRDYLRKQVGRSGEPVILMQHYGFDSFSIGDWNWWTPKQRRALHDLLADYNILAILHGHNHHAEHYRWPDPRRHAADLAAMFGTDIPASPRQYRIISCGGVCWVLRIRGNELIAAHLRGSDWSATPAAFVEKFPSN